MSSKIKVLIAICIFGWLFKHCYLLPIIGWEEHDITGFEFKINFSLPNGKKQ